MKTYIVDTYAWIAYFEGNKKFLSEIEQNILETPSIVLAELSKVLLVKKFDGKKMAEILDYVTESSIILELGKEQAISAGQISAGEGLSLVDGIIYSYAAKDRQLLTGDKHFEKKPNANYIAAIR
ncbi:MAG: PIN domain-containing protein [Candidatus Diapherotrites archaeon]|uniref:PIN domain-containing protein n=1 Tax=Candidatus Iainarchaeum sp. TaxID=3101447 RepID=A0A8T4KTV8_9ARCH|nr:PIN domain-containing protein [Candidatus Diapherotrites archaeon]